MFNLFVFNYWNVGSVNNIKNEFLVIDNKENYVILENDHDKFLFYDDNTLELGNKIKIKGDVIKLSKDSEFNTYLYSQKVFYLLDGSVTYNDYNISASSRIINSLLENKDERNKAILKLVLFNMKDESNSSFYEYFSEFSINFLIVISGFHINLLFKVLEKRHLLKYLVAMLYLVLLNLAVSSLKAFIYYVLKKMNKKLELKLNNMDLLSLLLVALLFINPCYCFQLGFIYTFLFSYSIELIRNIVNTKTIWSRALIKILIFMVSLPLILFSNYEVNVLSFMFTILFDFPISILFIFSLLYLFFDKFYLLYKLYVILLEFILSFASEHSFNIVFGKPGVLILFLLYLMIFGCLFFYQNKIKKGYLLCMFSYMTLLSVQFFIPIIDNREIVYFVDVGQGDCIALKIPNSKSVVLIDTGGSKYRDVASKDIIPFLKSKGISKVDKVIITHDDYDHGGGLESLLNNFNVGDVIDSSLLEVVTIGKKQFENLNVSESRDNDGSIVLYGEWGHIQYLFTGDISREKEKEIIEKNDLDVDVLKVSHHGSDTSTCEDLLNEIKPKIALIGVGKNNRYNHPNNKVVSILEDYHIKIYRTDLNGNISIYKSLFTNSIIIEKEKDML
jgi:competence protein ComEC